MVSVDVSHASENAKMHASLYSCRCCILAYNLSILFLRDWALARIIDGKGVAWHSLAFQSRCMPPLFLVLCSSFPARACALSFDLSDEVVFKGESATYPRCKHCPILGGSVWNIGSPGVIVDVKMLKLPGIMPPFQRFYRMITKRTRNLMFNKGTVSKANIAFSANISLSCQQCSKSWFDYCVILSQVRVIIETVIHPRFFWHVCQTTVYLRVMTEELLQLYWGGPRVVVMLHLQMFNEHSGSCFCLELHLHINLKFKKQR